jgi:hypothetical protein
MIHIIRAARGAGHSTGAVTITGTAYETGERWAGIPLRLMSAANGGGVIVAVAMTNIVGGYQFRMSAGFSGSIVCPYATTPGYINVNGATGPFSGNDFALSPVPGSGWPSGGGPTTLFFDTFARADSATLGTASCGMAWDSSGNGWTTIGISSNQAVEMAPGNGLVVGIKNLPGGDLDQFAQCQVYESGNYGAGPAVRVGTDSGGNVPGYMLVALPAYGYCWLAKATISGGGSATWYVQTFLTIANGDTFRIEARDNGDGTSTITGYQNGTQFVQIVDSDFQTNLGVGVVVFWAGGAATNFTAGTL